MEADVTEVDLVPFLEGVHTVVHLAALSDAAGSFERAEQVERNNYTATQKIAEACVQKGVRMIHLSSTSVYGTQKDVVDEDCLEEDLQPQSPYATTKLREEYLLGRMVAEQGLKAVTCRFGTIFGVSPGIRFHTAVNKFCWQAALGQAITIWQNAYNQKRPYLDLDDACNAIVHLIREDLFDGGLFNVLTLNATVRLIVETIKEFIPDLEVEFADSPIMNQLSYEVNCDRIIKTGFEAKGNLQQGISNTIDLLGLSLADRLMTSVT